MRTQSRRLVPLLLLLALLSGCIGNPPPEVEPEKMVGTLPVTAPPALAEALLAVKSEFESKNPKLQVQLSFLTPGTTTTVDPGTPGQEADVEIGETTTAPPETGTEFASTQLVIVVAAGNPKRISKLADLPKLGKRVALCPVESACGDAADAMLTAADVTLPAATRVPDTRKALGQVQAGTMDAALVYRPDARTAGDDVTTVEVGESGVVQVTFTGAATDSAKLPDAARAFVDFLTTQVAKDRIASFGFQVPE